MGDMRGDPGIACTEYLRSAGEEKIHPAGLCHCKVQTPRPGHRTSPWCSENVERGSSAIVVA
eukprot:570450-Pleurochrysis_carterae.AAC.1